MKIKHSKYKDTGLIYELLVKQITSDLVSRKESPAINILRKYYSGENALVQEHKLYRVILEGVNLSTIKADSLLGAAIKASRKINQRELQDLKYNLVSEIKRSYKLENFFSIPVAEYKTLAAFYCLLEADRSQQLIDPQFIVNNKITLLEHMTNRFQDSEDVTNSLIKEFGEQDRSLKLLTFKILLEKFNKKYASLLPEQKNVLQHIVTLGSVRELREFLNEEMKNIREKLQVEISKFPRSIEKIKLQESLKILEDIPVSGKVSDEKLTKVLQFYELLEELKKL